MTIGDAVTICLVLLALWTFIPRSLRTALRGGLEPTVIALASVVRAGTRVAAHVLTELAYKVLIGQVPPHHVKTPANYVALVDQDTPLEFVAAPVAATDREAAQPIAKPATPDNAELPRNDRNAALPTEARDIIRATALEQGKAQAVAALLKSGKLTNKAEAIEQVFQCRRNSRPGSTYMQAMALVEPLLAVEKYPGRTPEQEEFRKGFELA